MAETVKDYRIRTSIQLDQFNKDLGTFKTSFQQAMAEISGAAKTGNAQILAEQQNRLAQEIKITSQRVDAEKKAAKTISDEQKNAYDAVEKAHIELQDKLLKQATAARSNQNEAEKQRVMAEVELERKKFELFKQQTMERLQQVEKGSKEEFEIHKKYAEQSTALEKKTQAGEKKVQAIDKRSEAGNDRWLERAENTATVVQDIQKGNIGAGLTATLGPLAGAVGAAIDVFKELGAQVMETGKRGTEINQKWQILNQTISSSNPTFAANANNFTVIQAQIQNLERPLGFTIEQMQALATTIARFEKPEKIAETAAAFLDLAKASGDDKNVGKIAEKMAQLKPVMGDSIAATDLLAATMENFKGRAADPLGASMEGLAAVIPRATAVMGDGEKAAKQSAIIMSEFAKSGLDAGASAKATGGLFDSLNKAVSNPKMINALSKQLPEGMTLASIGLERGNIDGVKFIQFLQTGGGAAEGFTKEIQGMSQELGDSLGPKGKKALEALTSGFRATGQGIEQTAAKFDDIKGKANEMAEQMTSPFERAEEKFAKARAELTENSATGLASVAQMAMEAGATIMSSVAGAFESSERSAVRAKAAFDKTFQSSQELTQGAEGIAAAFQQIMATSGEGAAIENTFAQVKGHIKEIREVSPAAAKEVEAIINNPNAKTVENAEKLLKIMGDIGKIQAAESIEQGNEAIAKGLDNLYEKGSKWSQFWNGTLNNELTGRARIAAMVDQQRDRLADLNGMYEEAKAKSDAAIAGGDPHAIAEANRELNDIFKERANLQVEQMKREGRLDESAKQLVETRVKEAEAMHTQVNAQALRTEMEQSLLPLAGSNAEKQAEIKAMIEGQVGALEAKVKAQQEEADKVKQTAEAQALIAAAQAEAKGGAPNAVTDRLEGMIEEGAINDKILEQEAQKAGLQEQYAAAQLAVAENKKAELDAIVASGGVLDEQQQAEQARLQTVIDVNAAKITEIELGKQNVELKLTEKEATDVVNKLLEQKIGKEGQSTEKKIEGIKALMVENQGLIDQAKAQYESALAEIKAQQGLTQAVNATIGAQNELNKAKGSSIMATQVAIQDQYKELAALKANLDNREQIGKQLKNQLDTLTRQNRIEQEFGVKMGKQKGGKSDKGVYDDSDYKAWQESMKQLKEAGKEQLDALKLQLKHKEEEFKEQLQARQKQFQINEARFKAEQDLINKLKDFRQQLENQFNQWLFAGGAGIDKVVDPFKSAGEKMVETANRIQEALEKISDKLDEDAKKANEAMDREIGIINHESAIRAKAEEEFYRYQKSHQKATKAVEEFTEEYKKAGGTVKELERLAAKEEKERKEASDVASKKGDMSTRRKKGEKGKGGGKAGFGGSFEERVKVINGLADKISDLQIKLKKAEDAGKTGTAAVLDRQIKALYAQKEQAERELNASESSAGGAAYTPTQLGATKAEETANALAKKIERQKVLEAESKANMLDAKKRAEDADKAIKDAEDRQEEQKKKLAELEKQRAEKEATLYKIGGVERNITAFRDYGTELQKIIGLYDQAAGAGSVEDFNKKTQEADHALKNLRVSLEENGKSLEDLQDEFKQTFTSDMQALISAPLASTATREEKTERKRRITAFGEAPTLQKNAEIIQQTLDFTRATQGLTLMQKALHDEQAAGTKTAKETIDQYEQLKHAQTIDQQFAQKRQEMELALHDQYGVNIRLREAISDVEGISEQHRKNAAELENTIAEMQAQRLTAELAGDKKEMENIDSMIKGKQNARNMELKAADDYAAKEAELAKQLREGTIAAKDYEQALARIGDLKAKAKDDEYMTNLNKTVGTFKALSSNAITATQNVKEFYDAFHKGKDQTVTGEIAAGAKLAEQIGELLISSGIPALATAGAVLLGVGLVADAVAKISQMFGMEKSQADKEKEQLEIQKQINDAYSERLSLMKDLMDSGDAQLQTAKAQFDYTKAQNDLLRGSTDMNKDLAKLSDDQLRNKLKEWELSSEQYTRDINAGKIREKEIVQRSNGDVYEQESSATFQYQEQQKWIKAGADELKRRTEEQKLELQIVKDQISQYEVLAGLLTDLGNDAAEATKKAYNLKLKEVFQGLAKNGTKELQTAMEESGINYKDYIDSKTGQLKLDNLMNLSLEQIENVFANMTSQFDDLDPKVVAMFKTVIDAKKAMDAMPKNQAENVFKAQLELIDLKAKAGELIARINGETEEAYQKRNTAEANKQKLAVYEAELAYLQSINASEVEQLKVKGEIYQLQREINGELEKNDTVLNGLIIKHQTMLEQMRQMTHGGTLSPAQKEQLDAMKAQILMQLKSEGRSQDFIDAFMAGLPQYEQGGPTGEGGMIVSHPGEWMLNAREVKELGPNFFTALQSGVNPLAAIYSDAAKMVSMGMLRQQAGIANSNSSQSQYTLTQNNNFAHMPAEQGIIAANKGMEEFIVRTMNNKIQSGEVNPRR